MPVYAGYDAAEVKRALKRKEEPSYQGPSRVPDDTSFRPIATTQSDMMKRRVAQFLTSNDCPACHGKRLRPEALSVKFSGLDIADISRLPLKRLNVDSCRPYLGNANKTFTITPRRRWSSVGSSRIFKPGCRCCWI